MRGETAPKEPIFIPPQGVIARQSTDYFAVEAELVAAALRCVASRLAEKLSVNRIAEKLAVSPRALQLRFSAALGRPISEEIRRLRLTTAQRLLAELQTILEQAWELAPEGAVFVVNERYRR